MVDVSRIQQVASPAQSDTLKQHHVYALLAAIRNSRSPCQPSVTLRSLY